MVQFDNKRGTLPGLDMLEVFTRKREMTVKSDSSTGAAWLSSARVVRCWVKSRNERNPHSVLYFSQKTALVNREEGGDDVKSAWPLCPGLHTCYNGEYNGLPKRKLELIPSKLLIVRIAG